MFKVYVVVWNAFRKHRKIATAERYNVEDAFGRQALDEEFEGLKGFFDSPSAH